ncbi:hypothetical protein MalM14_17580 [Gimesia chilikensis]|nr:hypothetical protein MalM14_17580 [Gimesia chilikensis]
MWLPAERNDPYNSPHISIRQPLLSGKALAAGKHGWR